MDGCTSPAQALLLVETLCRLLGSPCRHRGRTMVADTPETVNDWRGSRVAEILDDFRTISLCIADAPCDPPNMDDYYTEGWAALRQCAIDNQNIADCAADITVPQSRGGPEEHSKAQYQLYVRVLSGCNRLANCFLSRIHLDAYARRHEGQKIYLRQAAARRWVAYREQVLQGGRTHSGIQSQLRAIDQQLRAVCLHIPRHL